MIHSGTTVIYTIYIAPLQDVIATFNLQRMFYADDTQLYITVKPSTPELAMDSLSLTGIHAIGCRLIVD